MAAARVTAAANTIPEVSDAGPFGPDPSGDDNPFEAMSFFLQDLSRMFSGQSGGSWDTAAQLAGSIANEGRPESNVDPLARGEVEQLARVAELQVTEITGRRVDDAAAGVVVGQPQHPVAVGAHADPVGLAVGVDRGVGGDEADQAHLSGDGHCDS